MFGTDNVFFVPEGTPLIFFDLYHACAWKLDVLQAQTIAAETMRQPLRDRLAAALDEHFEANPDLTGGQREELRRRVQGFFDAIRWIGDEAGYEAAWPLDALVAPLTATLWIRLSDAPLESFAEEDYRTGDEADGPADAAQYTPLFGALELRALGQWELKMPGEPGRMPFFLRWPDASRAIRREPLDPLQPLPIVEEYIGTAGVSALGHVANYTLKGALSEENSGAVPLCRQGGGRLFVTLYFHLAQHVEFDVTFNRLPAHPRLVHERLTANGFAAVRHDAGWVIYARGLATAPAVGPDDWRDVIHFYYDIEGKESYERPSAQPFLWIARAGGSPEPGERSKLIEELRGLFGVSPEHADGDIEPD
ncbi:MAG: hypothetical protein Kow0059_21380 [Candidatus Sumerlaeia bacterium]